MVRGSDAGSPMPDSGQGTAAESTPPAHEVVHHIVDAVVVGDAAGRIVLANPAAGRLVGRPAETMVGEPLVSIIPPRFRPAHQAGFDRFLATGIGRLVGGASVRVAALRSDGSEVPVELTLAAMGNPGEPQFAIVATIRDVSRRVDLEHRAVLSQYLQATVDAAQDGVIAWSTEERVLAVNQRFSEMWQLDSRLVRVGVDATALWQEHLAQVADPQALLDALNAAREHPMQTQSFEVTLADGRVFEGYGAPITAPDGELLGRVWYLHDDTSRRTDEAQRVALVNQLAKAERAQRFLLDASAVLAHASGVAETLEALARIAVPTLGDLCLIDVLDDHNRPRRAAAVHANPDVEPLVAELRTKYIPAPDGAHPSVAAMQYRQSRWSADMPDEFLRATTLDDRHFHIVKDLEFTSYMTVPLITGDVVLGTVTIVSAGSGRRFGPDDVALAEELAERVALVVAKERRYDTERVISHTLQTNLLPTELPTIEGVSFAVRYLPGTADTEVGGDFWDVAPMPTGEVAVAVGDVAGHDITAAATMAQLRSACRALRTQTTSPEQLIKLVHDSWEHLGLDRIATATFSRLHPRTGQLRIASAGHLPPLIVEPERAWFAEVEPAAPLGSPVPGVAKLWEGVLPTGATVVFYTDGLVEDRQRDIDEGTERLVLAAMSAPSSEPDELVDHILAALSGEARADDVAILAMRRTWA